MHKKLYSNFKKYIMKNELLFFICIYSLFYQLSYIIFHSIEVS